MDSGKKYCSVRGCLEQAPQKCQFCGKHCQPKCDADLEVKIHGRRQKPRGSKGQYSSQQRRFVFRAACNFIDEVLACPRASTIAMQSGLGLRGLTVLLYRYLISRCCDNDIEMDDFGLLFFMHPENFYEVWVQKEQVAFRDHMRAMDLTVDEVVNVDLTDQDVTIAAMPSTGASSSVTRAAMQPLPSTGASSSSELAKKKLRIELAALSSANLRATKADGSYCAHFERVNPPKLYIQGEYTLLDSPCPTPDVDLSLMVLKAFLRQRDLEQYFESISPQEFPWCFEKPEGGQFYTKERRDRALQEGLYFYLPYRKCRPQDLDAAARAQIRRREHKKYYQAFHASSFFCLATAVRCGLRPGIQEGAGNRIGIYCLQNYEMCRFNSLNFYAVYCRIALDLYMTAIFSLAVQVNSKLRSDAAAIATGKQWVVRPGYHDFIEEGLWVHVIDRKMLDHGLTTDRKFSEWLPDYEVVELDDRLHLK